jgi:hypothetical protein
MLPLFHWMVTEGKKETDPFDEKGYTKLIFL